MSNINDLQKTIEVAMGKRKADLVIKNAGVVNVFNNQIEQTDVAICDGMIVGLGSYEGIEELDETGHIICPGFIDGHIHLESSMVTPGEFAKTVIAHGTTAVITDPHEITNVAGLDGLDYMLDETRDLDMDVYFMLPSCVPATALDESGAVVSAEDLKPYYSNDRVLGLAEMMNSYGTVHCDTGVLSKINDAIDAGKAVDGHAPGIDGNALNAYVTAGVQSDHECVDDSEAKEKLSRGQWIMIREGTAAKNLEALISLFEAPYYHRCMLVTDDRHPSELIETGHIDYIIKKAVSLGADPIKAIIMGSFNAATYFGLKNTGAVAPGYKADIVVLDNLKDFNVLKVLKKGNVVSNKEAVVSADNKKERFARVFNSFNMKKVTVEDIVIKEDISNCTQRVIGLKPHDLSTDNLVFDVNENVDSTQYSAGVDVDRDIIKMVVFERHHNTGHIGIGFLKGYGLKNGAVATSVAHDSHNLIVAGTNDEDIVLAANTVRENQGGMAVVLQGKVIGSLPLEVAGLMTDKKAEYVFGQLEYMKNCLYEAGVNREIDPFMTLGFTSLPVIPRLRLNTYGLVDVKKQAIVPVFEKR